MKLKTFKAFFILHLWSSAIYSCTLVIYPLQDALVITHDSTREFPFKVHLFHVVEGGFLLLPFLLLEAALKCLLESKNISDVYKYGPGIVP